MPHPRRRPAAAPSRSPKRTTLPQGLRRGGITSYRGVAEAFNNRGGRTAHGGRWQVSNVRNLIARAGSQSETAF